MLIPSFNTPYGNAQTSSVKYKCDVLAECQSAIQEGIMDELLLETQASYTSSLILEVLENIKSILLSLIEKIISILNNYILNNVKIADKYEDLIFARYRKLKDPIEYRTYEFVDLYTYPIHYKSISFDMVERTREIATYALSLDNYNDNVLVEKVNRAIEDFSVAVISEPTDPYNVAETTREICFDIMRGREQIKRLTIQDLSDFFVEIRQYSKIKSEIHKTRNEVETYYRNLKKQTLSNFKLKPLYDENNLMINKLTRSRSKSQEPITQDRFQQISFGDSEMKRLFDAFLTIYNNAFTIKLQLIKAKIELNKNLISEVLTRTSLFAAANADYQIVNRRKYGLYALKS